MKRVALLLYVFLLTAQTVPASSTGTISRRPAREGEAVRWSGELLVGWDETVTRETLAGREAEIARSLGLDFENGPVLDAFGASRVRVRGVDDGARMAAMLRAIPGVRYAEPNFEIYPARTPGDPLYGGVNDVATELQRWAYGGLGEDLVLNAEDAWEITSGDPGVVIAIIDSGYDFDGTDRVLLWENEREQPGNGIDDDGNGYVDDVHGYNFHEKNGDVQATAGDGQDNDFDGEADNSASHGPNVSSILGAAHDGVGMVGAAPDCSQMIVKVFGDDGGVLVSDLVLAMKYATDNGADVLNMSLSSPFDQTTLKDATKYAIDRKVVVVAAAGNTNSAARQFPASYPDVISVGGSDGGFYNGSRPGDVNGRWRQSAYGSAAVDVVAPAVTLAASIVTVADTNEPDHDPGLAAGDTVYTIVEGTSFATPYVAGMAGLIVARDIALHGKRTLTGEDIEALVLKNAVDLPFDGSAGTPSGANWDGRGRVDFLRGLLDIPGGAIVPPSVTQMSFRKKELRIYGDDFSEASRIEVNGEVLPNTVTFSYIEGSLRVQGSRKALKLKKGPNSVVVIDRDLRSEPYALLI